MAAYSCQRGLINHCSFQLNYCKDLNLWLRMPWTPSDKGTWAGSYRERGRDPGNKGGCQRTTWTENAVLGRSLIQRASTLVAQGPVLQLWVSPVTLGYLILFRPLSFTFLEREWLVVELADKNTFGYAWWHRTDVPEPSLGEGVEWSGWGFRVSLGYVKPWLRQQSKTIIWSPACHFLSRLRDAVFSGSTLEGSGSSSLHTAERHRCSALEGLCISSI